MNMSSMKKWDKTPGPPIAAIHVIHGMCEHSALYEATAQALNKKGIVVWAQDLIGHGPKTPHLGHLVPGKGWHDLCKESYALGKALQQAYPDIPRFLLGHSMGSFLAQNVMSKSEPMLYQGLLLSGSTYESPLLTRFAKAVAGVLMSVFGKSAPGTFFYWCTFKLYNLPFRPSRTAFDWLSRDTNAVDAYTKDPYCGFVPTLGFYYELFNGLALTYQRSAMIQIREPIYCFSGTKDAVGKMGRGVKNLVKRHRALQHPITLKLYPEGRHVMLQETNKEEVLEDCVAWIKTFLRKPE